MKCNNCPALKTEGYEYPESYCAVYLEDECIEFKDGSLGCRHTRKVIEKRLEQNEDLRAHEWDGFAEWYEEDMKIERAVKQSVINACELTNTSLAYDGADDKLYAVKMDFEIPSFLQDFVFRFRQALEYQGYDIVKREDKNNENNQT